LEKLLKEKGKNPRKFSNCFNCWSHSRQLRNYELKTHWSESNLLKLVRFMNFQDSSNNSQSDKLNLKSFLSVCTLDTFSWNLFDGKLFAFQVEFKFMKIDGKFHWKIFEDQKEIRYPKNWNFRILIPFCFQAAAGEANSRKSIDEKFRGKDTGSIHFIVFILNSFCLQNQGKKFKTERKDIAIDPPFVKVKFQTCFLINFLRIRFKMVKTKTKFPE
jgi:hypothetical protein